MKRRPWKFSFSILLGLAAIMPAKPGFAGSATWAHKSVTSDWKNPANWTPSVVPDGAADVATFSDSKSLLVTLAASDEVSAITFTSAVPHPYALFVIGLTISGSGVTNNSNQNSAFWTYSDPNFGVSGTILFENSATAGSNLTYNVTGVPDGSSDPVGELVFTGQSNAGTVFCENYAGGSTIEFHDSSTASAATVFSLGGRGDDTGDLFGGSYLSFYDNSNASNASVQNLEAISVSSTVLRFKRTRLRQGELRLAAALGLTWSI